jgi:cyclin H
MFNYSSQKSNWLFKDASELAEIRKKTNSEYVKKQTSDLSYLSYEEEKVILLHYEYQLKIFCGNFKPPITIPSVIGTSITYFKRFYLKNSAMDFHPRDMYLVCVYLACKIEEFNISMSQFLLNINSNDDKEEFANAILNYELLLIEKLDFNLTVHNFYRPYEGFLLDVKTRCPEIQNIDILRGYACDFLDKILNTDGILLYPPSQIALTGVVYSASKNKIDLDKYCQSILLHECNDEEVKQLCKMIKTINRLHREIPILNQDEVKRIEKKLQSCYNLANDPRSKIFKERVKKLLEEEEPM